jgi:O-antigen/teichoic acid export membrane protein
LQQAEVATQLAVEAQADGGRKPLSVTWNALAVMAGKTLTMGLGFLFWLVAAHQFSRPDVGVAAAAVSAMMLCTQLAIGGVGSAVITCFAEFRHRPADLLDTSGTVVIASAVLAALGFFIVAALGLRHLDAVPAHPLYALAFVAMTIFGTLAILIDEISISLGRGEQVLVRGVVFGATTLAGIGVLPMMLHHAGSAAIFAPWAVAGAANVALGIYQVRRMLPGYHFRPRVERDMRRLLLRHGSPNYALTLAERAPGLVLPIVVTQVLTPADNSTWYAVWMMAWVVYTLPISAGLTLFAEGSNRPAQLAQATRAAVRVALVVGVVSSLLIGSLAHFALSLLGSAYGATGAGPLRILLLAFVPITFVQAYFAGSRARRQLGEAVATGWISAAASVVAATAGALVGGLEGMAYAWLAVQTATGVWAIARTATFWRNPVECAWGRSGPIAEAAGRIAVRAGTGARVAAVAYGRANLVAAAGAVCALLIWSFSLRHVVLGRMNGLGLVSVLHISFYVSVAVITVTFLVALLRRQVSERVLLGLVVVLIFMLFGLTPILESVPRFAVAWRHVGIAQAILDTGHVNPRIDAYFNWPGFFILVAALVRAAGFHNALPLTAWSPVYFNLAYLVPLLVIARSLTSSRRLVWLSIWLFFLGNWIGQDYFSPQGFTLFLYLVVVAVLLRYFVPQPEDPTMRPPFILRALGRVREPEPELVPATAPAPPRKALIACIVLLFVVLVPTHQLTPLAVLFATTAVVIVAARSLLWLPPLMAVLLGGWYATGARTYFHGHLATMLASAGQLDAVFSKNVGSRVGGDFGHRVVADLSILAGAAMWGLALLGALRLLRRDSRYRVGVALALAPLTMLPAQTYGGEMLLRVELFSLPFTAFFAAAALVGDDDEIRIDTRRAAAVGGVLLVFAGLFLFARYGNERMDHFTRSETTAVRHLYALAKPGSTLVAGTGDLPWKYTEYEDHIYRFVTYMPHWSATARVTHHPWAVLEDIREAMISSRKRSYLIIGRSEEYQVNQLGYGRPSSLTRLAEAVADSPFFKVVYRNPDATIFTLAPLRTLTLQQLLAENPANTKHLPAGRAKRRLKP